MKVDYYFNQPLFVSKENKMINKYMPTALKLLPEDAKRIKASILKAISNNISPEEKSERKIESERLRKSYNIIREIWKD